MIRLFRVFVPVGVLALLFSEVILVATSFVLAAFLVLQVDPTIFLLYDGGLVRIFLATLSIIIGLHFQDLYSRIQVKYGMLFLQQLSLVIGVAWIAEGLVSYLIPNLALPRWVMLLGSALTAVSLLAWRVFYSNYILHAVGAQRILFVGANPAIEEIAGHIRSHPEYGLIPDGYVDDSFPPGTQINGVPVIGPIKNLLEIASEVHPDRIVVGMSERRDRMPVHDLLELRFAGYLIEEASSTYEAVCSRICTKELRPGQLIFSGELGPRSGSIHLQTLLNVSFSLAGVILTFPLMLLTALAVRLSSPGPILYRQPRVGMDGVSFVVYKFRSMYNDAEDRTGAVWASKDDPRVTKVGRVLRKFRLDELPQFFNVLRGEMSLVGPRPERPEFVKTLSEKIPFYRQRQCVKPGITGWAQINYKYGDTLQDTITKLEYDLYYIKHMSLSLDAYIVFETLKTIILSRGAQ